METLRVKIEHIKNIKKASLEFPIDNSMNLIVGANGSGKSTIIQALSQAISKQPLKNLQQGDYNDASFVELSIEGKVDLWEGKNNWYLRNVSINLNGMFEGSLFYGTRFNDSKLVDKLLQEGKIPPEDIVDADEYIKEKMSYILHGIPGKYPNLKKIRNKYIARRLNLVGTPYFNLTNGYLISQYRMSSGECLLVSLLHFIYNAIVRRSLPRNKLILILIDEIEVALHPIAVSRFLDLLNELLRSSSNLMIILSSHSPEVIRKIPPNNIFKIENNDGYVEVINPCYPSYVIRDVYKHEGFDYLLLVEDELTKIIVDKILDQCNIKSSKLVHIVPVGGWNNVLRLQRDLLQNNVLGLGREVISIIDGDAKNDVPNEFKHFKKLFLPIECVEKFLYKNLVESPNQRMKKIINDKYFQVDSIDTLISEYHKKYPTKPDHAEKKFYFKPKLCSSGPACPVVA